MWFKGSQYLRKMGGVILIASLIIWALGYFPLNSKKAEEYDQLIHQTEMYYNNLLENKTVKKEDISKLNNEKISKLYDLNLEKVNYLQENSFIGMIGKFIEPVMRPLGFDWKMSVSLLAGVAAKEVVISTLGILYQVETDPAENPELLENRLRNAKHTDGTYTGLPIFTKITAFAYLMFILLYFPCVAVVAAIKKESGQWKWAVFTITYTTAVAWAVAFIVNQVGSFFY